MLIDWFTVAAQAVNFLVLVWLLKRFLYRPVLAAIDAREHRIATQLAQATERAAQAELERADFQRRNESLEHERGGLLRKAAEEAAAERQRLFEAARQDAQALRSKLADAWASDRENLARRLSSETQAEVLALTRKTLADLAGIPVEDRMVEVFLEHLRALPDEQRRLLAADTGRVPPAAMVHSACELSLTRRTAIKAALGECLGTGLIVRFELAPELICGLDVTINGVKLAWSVNDYLVSMADRLTALLAPAQSIPASPSLEAARHG